MVESSPGSFQAWLRHPQPLSREFGTLAAKTLAEQFAADSSAADWRRFGRAPGFTNRKSQHRDTRGLYPFAKLRSASGQPFAAHAYFHTLLHAAQLRIDGNRAAARLNFAAHPPRFAAPLSLLRFRTLARYAGRPAAGDMAFSIAACARGWAKADIAAALASNYLSRDTSKPVRTPTSGASFQGRALGSLKMRGRTRFGFSPSLFPPVLTRSMLSAC